MFMLFMLAVSWFLTWFQFPEYSALTTFWLISVLYIARVIQEKG